MENQKKPGLELLGDWDGANRQTYFGVILRPANLPTGRLALPMGSRVKDLPTMQEIQVQSLGREDPLDKGMATHSRILENSMERGA